MFGYLFGVALVVLGLVTIAISAAYYGCALGPLGTALVVIGGGGALLSILRITTDKEAIK